MRNPVFLRLWAIGIGALGLWHIVSWRQDLNPNKDGFTLAVGMFCVVIGVLALLFSFEILGKRKDN